jgi:hypothetical protein
MPQLDIYILYNLVQTILLFWCLLFLLNISNILLNIFLSLKIIKLKFFVEKQFLKKLFKEIFFFKNLRFFKKNLLLILNLYLNIKNKLFIENLLDIYNLTIKIYNKILKKNIKNNIISKINLEFYRNLI